MHFKRTPKTERRPKLGEVGGLRWEGERWCSLETKQDFTIQWKKKNKQKKNNSCYFRCRANSVEIAAVPSSGENSATPAVGMVDSPLTLNPNHPIQPPSFSLGSTLSLLNKDVRGPTHPEYSRCGRKPLSGLGSTWKEVRLKGRERRAGSGIELRAQTGACASQLTGPYIRLWVLLTHSGGLIDFL